MICDTCGQNYEIGQWYRCPHDPVRGGRGAAVTWPGGKTFENLGHQPQTFYSPAELSRYCKAHDIEPFVRHVPVPGTDRSPHTVDWSKGSIDAQTLANAAALVARAGTPTPTAVPTYITSMTVTMTEVPGYITEPIAGIHVK